MARDVVTDLDTVLKEEREALRSGSLDRIGPLAERKEALISTLEESGPNVASKTDLERLQAGLAQNANLLSSARAGLGAALARTKERHRVATHLDVYTRQGTIEDLRSGRGKVDNRA
ncbi:MAG: hypothetical protein AAFR47_09975 [Pseudomonadota bacterium]